MKEISVDAKSKVSSLLRQVLFKWLVCLFARPLREWAESLSGYKTGHEVNDVAFPKAAKRFDPYPGYF